MHERWQQLLPEYINDTLPESERKALEAHLKTCSECRQVLEEWRAIADVALMETQDRSRPLPPLLDVMNGKLDSPVSDTQLTKEEIDMTTLRLPRQKSYSIPWTAAAVLLLTFFFSVLLLGSLDLQPVPIQQQGLGDIPEDPIALFEFYIDEVWNKKNLEAIPELLTQDHIHHDSSLTIAQTIGLQGQSLYVTYQHQILPDVTFTPTDLLAHDSSITGRVTMSYEEFEATVLVNATITDGKLTETWFDVSALAEAYNLDFYTRFWEMVDNTETIEDADLVPFMNANYRWHHAAGTHIMTISRTREAEFLNDYKRACKDWQGERVLIAQSDIVLSQSIGSCMFDEPMLNWGMTINPPNMQVNNEAVWLWRVEEGKLVENWWYIDEPWFWASTVDYLTTPQSFAGDTEIRAAYEANSVQIQSHLFAQRFVDTIWNTEELDLAIFNDLYTVNTWYDYDVDSGQTVQEQQHSREETFEFYRAIHQAFPDGHMDVDAIFTSGSKVSIQFTWTGTHSNTFKYGDIVLPATNEVVLTNGMIVLSILETHSKISREVWYADFPFLANIEQIASR